MKVSWVISSTLYLTGMVLMGSLAISVAGEGTQLSTFLPQLMSIHESCKSLAQANSLLRSRILDGLANNNNTKSSQDNKSSAPLCSSSLVPTSGLASKNSNQTLTVNTNKTINYQELEAFNKWVGENLEYAIKNTFATAEALKDEALENNGTVDYSLSFIEDGQNGVKYWQMAVVFQDKTLKNEKFEIDSL